MNRLYKAGKINNQVRVLQLSHLEHNISVLEALMWGEMPSRKTYISIVGHFQNRVASVSGE